MSQPSSEGGRSSLLVGTIKSVAIVAALSYLAANWLSAGSYDQHGLGRLAFDASRDLQDPTTTGTIARRADATKLDPCTMPRRP